MTVENPKLTGSFYTEGKVAESIVNWAIRSSNESVLEPSFGNGVFINKFFYRFKQLGNLHPNISAVEIQQKVVENVLINLPFNNVNILISDFLLLNITDNFDVVVGNPPYVSIKKLPDEQYLAARRVIDEYNVKVPDNGSIWLPFVLHAINALKLNGRLGFVLPFEITYARYVYGLWKILSNNFTNLTINRIHEDFFPDVDVETILLFAEGKGGKTKYVDYNIFNTVNDLLNKNVATHKKISLTDIINNEKPFVSTILSSTQQKMFQDFKKNNIIKPIISDCKFKIGYVAGDKNYFHPNADTVKQYSIPTKNLFPTILNAKSLNGNTGIGIEISIDDCSSKLYLPQRITEGDNLYIQNGEKLGVHKRYKCRNRSPWYITPNVEIPDIILSVFGEVPKMVINKGKYTVSNSLLCGYLKNISAEQLLCRWYNSLTLLSLELNVHSLGGGSFVIIPGEADRLEIVNNIPEGKVLNIYRQLNDAVKKHGTEYAYTLGDKIVLEDIFGLTNQEIAAIRKAISSLRNWRVPSNRQ